MNIQDALKGNEKVTRADNPNHYAQWRIQRFTWDESRCDFKRNLSFIVFVRFVFLAPFKWFT